MNEHPCPEEVLWGLTRVGIFVSDEKWSEAVQHIEAARARLRGMTSGEIHADILRSLRGEQSKEHKGAVVTEYPKRAADLRPLESLTVRFA